MSKTNEARACEVVSDVLGTVNWEMGDGGHIIIFGQSKAIHLTLNGIYTHVLKAIDKAEKRERRKVCCEPAPQFDADRVWYLIELYAHNRWQEGRQFGPNDNSVMSCDDFHNRAEYYGHRLLAALHIE